MVIIEEKYKHLPSPGESNWVLVSMGDINRMKRYLNNFPAQIEENQDDLYMSMNQSACSSTLIWSGITGNNTPIKLFTDYPFGFILDPKKITLPHAEFFAKRTGSVIPKELTKKDVTFKDTKHPDKPVRIDEFYDQKTLVTNYAKYDPISGSSYPEGTAEVFASAVWYKYHKKFPQKGEEAAQIADLNEGLVVAKSKEYNPISGIVIRADFFSKITDTEKGELIAILQENPYFKLLIYKPTLKENIMREVNGLEKQISFLLQKDLNSTDLEQFSPFKGFSTEEAISSIGINTDNIINKTFENNFIIKPHNKPR